MRSVKVLQLRPVALEAGELQEIGEVPAVGVSAEHVSHAFLFFMSGQFTRDCRNRLSPNTDWEAYQ